MEMCFFHYPLMFVSCYSTCVLLGQPTCCWTGAVQRFPQWGRWVTGWMEWGPCPARRPSLGSATALVIPWPRPPQSKTTTHTDTHTKLLCLFMSAVFTEPQYPWQDPGIWRGSWWRTHTHTHLFSVSKESYRALTEGVRMRVMVIHNDRPLDMLTMLQVWPQREKVRALKERDK